MARCRVSFTDCDGIPHAVEVQADSLFEALAMAVAEFRSDPMTEQPGAMTEFTVAIQRPPIEHRIRLGQVAKWAQASSTEEPAGIIKETENQGLAWQRVCTALSPKIGRHPCPIGKCFDTGWPHT